MKLFLDDQGLDIRASWVKPGWEVVTTPEEFKKRNTEALANQEPIEAISFDNDLGVSIEGRDLVKWL